MLKLPWRSAPIQEWKVNMIRIAAITIFLALVLCACETTATGRYSSETDDSPSYGITVGGDVTVRGQYQSGD